MPAETVIQRWDDDAVLVDLDPPTVARVRPRRSIWPAVILAVFTGLTGAGLTMSTGASPWAVSSQDTSERPSSVPPDSVDHGEMRSLHAPETVASSGGPSPSVVATARLVRVAGHASVIRVTGIAAYGVDRVDVVVRLGGHAVGRATARIDPAVSLPAANTSGGSVAPWAVDVALTDPKQADARDGVVTVEVRWPGSSGEAGGTAVLVVALGDGRSAG